MAFIMSPFISPVANETITKLQYLLQNTLYTYTDIISSLAPNSTDETSENNNECVNSSDVGSNVRCSLSEKIDRLETLNAQIQSNVDLLPDSSLYEDMESRIQILSSESERASVELKALHEEFDKAYKLIRTGLNREMNNRHF